MTESGSFVRLSPVGAKPAFQVFVVIMSLALTFGSADIRAATFVVTNINTPGVGFNDTTPVAPVAGNPATTLGAQRMAVFQAAADSWGALLQSPVSIVVSAQMTSLNCSTNSATLGSAGADAVFSDFDNAPLTNTWYPVALANALAGVDLDSDSADINANFNQDIGKPDCLASRPWSYVIGAPTPDNTISFFDTVVHEIGHGLGVFSMVNTRTGEMPWNLSDSYTQHLLDETPTPVLWPALSDAGRAASAIDTGNLTWNGASVSAVANLISAGRHVTSSRVRMYAPSSLTSGSSVSHFDTALSPHEIMEPSLNSVTRRRLANHLMLDLGWHARVNLAVSNSDEEDDLPAGSATTYTITVQNNSVADLTAINLGVINTMPAALQGVSWSCSGLAGGACTVASGLGDINAQVSIPQAGSVVFTINAAINGAFIGELSNTVNLVLPANLENQNSATLTATDTTNVTLPAADPAGISISSISGNTTESGISATFSVVLDTQPTGNVSLNLISNDMTEGTAAPGNLVFTTGNWNVPQFITVSGLDDDVDDGDINYTVTTAVAGSADEAYQNLDSSLVSVTNLDDDTAGFEISAVSGHTTEAGLTATFTIEMNSEPTADVSISLSSSNEAEGLVSPSSVSFTPGTWFEARLVTITGQDDALEDGDILYSIVTAATVSLDPNYSGLDPADVNLTNVDDDSGVIFKDSFDSP